MRALLVGVALVGAAIFQDGFVIAFPFLLALFALTWLGRAWHYRRRLGDVTVTERGVEVDGALRLPRHAIVDGFYQPRDMTHGVRLLGKRRAIAFEALVSSEARALDLLRALSLDPTARRAEFSGASPLHGGLLAQLLFAVGSVLFFLVVTSFLARRGAPPHVGGALLGLWFLVSVLPSKITIGIDGVHARWLLHDRFFPVGAIERVSPVGDRGVRLDLASGDAPVLYTSMRRKRTTEAQRQHRDAVLARIEQAIAAYRARAASPEAASQVARGARTLEAWSEALRGLGAARGGYRDISLRRDDLLRVVEDPSVREDARAGAAWVLRRELDADERRRVRVAADVTASPELRAALDDALDTQELGDTRMEASLARFTSPVDRGRRRDR